LGVRIDGGYDIGSVRRDSSAPSATSSAGIAAQNGYRKMETDTFIGIKGIRGEERAYEISRI